MKMDELKTTAELAQLRLSDEEFEKLSVEVSSMLDYFEKMMEVDIEGLEATTHALVKGNKVRKDQPEGDLNLADELVENAPEIEDRFMVIPNVL